MLFFIDCIFKFLLVFSFNLFPNHLDICYSSNNRLKVRSNLKLIQSRSRSISSIIGMLEMLLEARFPTIANLFLANASQLEYENFFILSASYRSTSKEYALVSARWKPCFIFCQRWCTSKFSKPTTRIFTTSRHQRAVWLTQLFILS